MRLSYLREFIELSKTLNYNEAARKLHLSQSALSKHIQALEGDLEANLFERDKHHVVLTSQGEVFLDCANRMCSIYEDIRLNFKTEAQNQARLFVGGLIDSPGEFAWLSKASKALQALLPDFSPHFIPVSSASPITQVVNGDIDCALIAFQATDYDDQVSDVLESVEVARSPFVAVVSAQNPLASRKQLTIEDLRDRTFIRMMGPRMTSGWSVIDRLLQRNHVNFATKQVTILSVYDYVGIGLNDELLLLPECETRRQEARNPDRKVLQLDIPGAFTPISAVYRKDSVSSALQAFIEELKRTPL